MLRLEDYVARRKKEDKLDEFDPERHSENLRACVNYVFEYFNNYLSITEAEERTALKSEKIEKYRSQVRQYDPEIQEWLVRIYSEFEVLPNRAIRHALRDNELFLLLSTDEEFRSLSYDIYYRLIRKCHFLKDQTEMLFLFIKDHHRCESEAAWRSDFPVITEAMTEWIEDTWAKHHVNLVAFSDRWVQDFYDSEDTWPPTHRRKSQETWRRWEYDHKQSTNLFNLDSLYRKMPRTSFTKGRKQEFEVMMMYFWLKQIVGDDDGYWQVYLDRVVPVLQAKA